MQAIQPGVPVLSGIFGCATCTTYAAALLSSHRVASPKGELLLTRRRLDSPPTRPATTTARPEIHKPTRGPHLSTATGAAPARAGQPSHAAPMTTWTLTTTSRDEHHTIIGTADTTEQARQRLTASHTAIAGSGDGQRPRYTLHIGGQSAAIINTGDDELGRPDHASAAGMLTQLDRPRNPYTHWHTLTKETTPTDIDYALNLEIHRRPRRATPAAAVSVQLCASRLTRNIRRHRSTHRRCRRRSPPRQRRHRLEQQAQRAQGRRRQSSRRLADLGEDHRRHHQPRRDPPPHPRCRPRP